MRFNLRRPCPNCPFRIDIAGYLRRERARDIIEALLADDWSWFGCHETTEYIEDEETSLGDQACVDSTQQCVGSLILLLKLGRPNVATRIAAAIGLIDLDAIEMTVPVADSVEGFIEHHAGDLEGKNVMTNQLTDF
jgi:hypothetical protein